VVSDPSHLSLPLSRRSLGLSAVSILAFGMYGAPWAQPLPKRPHDGDIDVVYDILRTPEAEIDLAKAKLTIDRLIDPSIDASAVLAQLDDMAASLRALLPADASKRLTLDALRYHLYQPSPWNGHRPFGYDMKDPRGLNVRNKLLSTYLTERKGNCVSMPLLFVILGQKLGIDVTVATTPNHVFVKYRDDEGKLYNLETTSGAGFTRDEWLQQQFPMSGRALASGIYMRPLTKKETVVVMVGTLLEFYGRRHMAEHRIAMAGLAMHYAKRDVSVMLHQHAGYLLLKGFLAIPNDAPQDVVTTYREQMDQIDFAMRELYERAYGLGWRPSGQF
jgi:regulator of sirC expression with transglutaminase-like and TPR domain